MKWLKCLIWLLVYFIHLLNSHLDESRHRTQNYFFFQDDIYIEICFKPIFF